MAACRCLLPARPEAANRSTRRPPQTGPIVPSSSPTSWPLARWLLRPSSTSTTSAAERHSREKRLPAGAGLLSAPAPLTRTRDACARRSPQARAPTRAALLVCYVFFSSEAAHECHLPAPRPAIAVLVSQRRAERGPAMAADGGTQPNCRAWSIGALVAIFCPSHYIHPAHFGSSRTRLRVQQAACDFPPSGARSPSPICAA